jgi:glutamate--cysteine ligase
MHALEAFIEQNESKINAWIEEKKAGKEFFYSSCDIRYSGFKITQVDANCFPAGFNNLNKASYETAVALYKDFFITKSIKNILIFPEFHTRNFGYLKNIKTLKAIFEQAGAKVKVATNLETKFNIDLSQSDIKSISEEIGLEENTIEFDPIKKYKWFFQKKYTIRTTDCPEKEKKLKPDCFTADMVVLNNDLTLGKPDILKNINIPILPLPQMGWFNRSKTKHFKYYAEVVNEFAKDFSIDPWIFTSYFEEVNDLNFKEGKGIEGLESKLGDMFEKISSKYREYNIDDKPTIFIKPNKGTYGMGIHPISSIEEVKNFNKNIRKKMNTVKDGLQVTSVILQEGVPTILRTTEGKAVEPVVYSVLTNPIGMFFRINEGFLSNLNANGMELVNNFPISETLKYLSNMIASFANLAIIRETENLLEK